MRISGNSKQAKTSVGPQLGSPLPPTARFAPLFSAMALPMKKTAMKKAMKANPMKAMAKKGMKACLQAMPRADRFERLISSRISCTPGVR